MFFERSIESYDAYLNSRVVEYKQTSQCFVLFGISVTKVVSTSLLRGLLLKDSKSNNVCLFKWLNS